MSEVGERQRVLSKEEQLERERQRQTRVGITSYSYEKDIDSVVIPCGGELYIIENISRLGPQVCVL